MTAHTQTLRNDDARDAQILVAGVGNAWMGDDGFGAEVVERLLERELPPGVQLVDFGTGGLDLAYEVMRGYDALVLVDASRRGYVAGTLCVLDVAEEDVSGTIENGERLNPHAMDPQSVLRFVRAVGGWPGRVKVIACEPANLDATGWGLSEPVQAALGDAVELVIETVETLRATAAARA